MVLYLLSQYDKSFALAVKISDYEYEVLPGYEHIDGSLSVATLYEMAKNLGVKKLVLDF